MPNRPDRFELPRLREWLVERIAFYLNHDPAEFDHSVRLSDYGLDSVYAVAVCGDVTDHFGIRMDTKMIWDHPSIDMLVTFLTAARATTNVPTRRPGTMTGYVSVPGHAASHANNHTTNHAANHTPSHTTGHAPAHAPMYSSARAPAHVPTHVPVRTPVTAHASAAD